MECRKEEVDMKKKVLLLILVSALMLVMSACGTGQTEEQNEEQNTEAKASETEAQKTDMEIQLMIGDQEVKVDWEDNEAVEALAKQVKKQPLTVELSMYGGFEQVGDLGMRLPADDVQIKTESGDIMLYAGDQIVLFYGQNSWAYTRLGKIKDKNKEEMAELLGQHDVTITLK